MNDGGQNHSPTATAQPYTSTGPERGSSFSERTCTTLFNIHHPNFINVHNSLANDKPSAIFRLRGNFTSQTSSTAHSIFSGASTPTADVSLHGVTALLGLAIEPLPQIISELASLQQGQLAQRNNDPAADAT